jgi:glycosyltransferase involved in cell wall biosynthesis
MSDVYVMPSVSEPFGLTALEAIQYGVPVILSKSSGAAEVLHRGVLKVDFWDVDTMANDILAILEHPPLRADLLQAGQEEVRELTWEKAADKCVAVYDEQALVLAG